MGLEVSIDSRNDFEVVTEMIQPGVIADVVDKGLVDNKFKPGTKQRKGYLVWIVAEEDSEGRQKRVFESFTLSLHEKASLRKRLKNLGFKDEAFAPGTSFDLDSIVGMQRMLVLSVEDGDNGKPFVKVTSTMPLKKGQTGVEIPKGFVRKKDTEGYVAPKLPETRKPSAAPKANDGITDDDIPF